MTHSTPNQAEPAENELLPRVKQYISDIVEGVPHKATSRINLEAVLRHQRAMSPSQIEAFYARIAAMCLRSAFTSDSEVHALAEDMLSDRKKSIAD